MKHDEFDHEAEERWDATFHALSDPTIRTGVEAAQAHLDDGYLEWLDRDDHLEPACAIDGCEYPAMAAAFCRTTNRLVLMTCAAHREQLLNIRFTTRCTGCGNTGRAVAMFRWQPLFGHADRRSGMERKR